MLNTTAPYFPTHFLLEAISNYQAFPAVTSGVIWHILESIHKVLFIIERLTLMYLIICSGVW